MWCNFDWLSIIDKMNALFWTGKLSFPMRIIMDANNMLAWITGNSRNKKAMKDRIQMGYNGTFSQHVTHYDELAGEFQKRSAAFQLYGIDINGKELIDIGGGTGIVALMALELGAAKVMCGDVSEYMLECSREKAKAKGYDSSRIEFCQLDAESLPFNNNSFDIVLTGNTFGILPDQKKAVKEMFRVLRPGGFVSLGAHGPEHYWEAIDATLRVINKKYVLGYRLEFWPLTEKQIHLLMEDAGFKHIRTNRFIWRNIFKNPVDACDFFASVTSSWWYGLMPEAKRDYEYLKTQMYFEKKGISQVTDDIIVGYGLKY
jgi:ubiquinone/menaquinone biosynthesis C-methylase UbiE